MKKKSKIKKPRVSVIVSSKNEAKVIESCLRSIRNQTFQDFELILSDAVSKDRTVKIAEPYADKIIVKKTNVSAGRNLGASFARGEILVFVDADTVLMEDTLEKIVKAFKKGVVGATCPALPTHADPRYVGVYMFHNNFSRASIKVGRPQVAGFFCAYRRTAFEKIEGFDETVGVLEDYHLSQRIVKLGKIEFVTDTIVLTSHRRLKEWGFRVPQKYLTAWIRLLATGKSFNHDWYKPVR